MPSEELDTRILEVLAQPVGVFRSSLAATAEQVRVAVEAHPVSGNGRPPAAGAELGAFASGRMDAERFTSLLVRSEDLDDTTLARIQDAHVALTALLERSDTLLHVDVAPGGNLRDAVAVALAEIGRAFGAARTFDLARSARFQPAEHASLVRGFGFERWSKAERECAPPLIVHVDGADLRTGGLIEFLDGALKIVLVVRGAATAAPLVPLLRPHAFVMQVSDASDLARLAMWEGAAVAALVPEGAARFIHDPSGGDQSWSRLAVEFVPEAPRAAVGGYSVSQQAEDLEQLAALALKPRAPSAPPAPPQNNEPVTDPADRLAAWLIEQADLKDTV